METTHQRASRIILSLFFGATILLGNSAAKGDAISEMASFSAFGNIDLAQLATDRSENGARSADE